MLQTLSRDKFRKKLAGLADPSAETPNHPFGFKQQAISLATVMARVFSDELDRKTLWNKIGAGLKSASQKRPEGGDSLIAAALESVLAEPGRAAMLPELEELILGVAEQEEEWNRGWAAYITRSSVIIVVHARALWNREKENKNAK